MKIRFDLFWLKAYLHIECIVVDGGSVDNTISAIEKYVPLFEGRLKYISEADSGVYEAMNKGLRMATGDVVGYRILTMFLKIGM